MMSTLSFKSAIRVCIHLTSKVESLNEIYFCFSREVTHFDARIRNSTASGIKLQTLKVYDHQLEKSYLDGVEGREVFSFSIFPWDTLYFHCTRNSPPVYLYLNDTIFVRYSISLSLLIKNPNSFQKRSRRK